MDLVDSYYFWLLPQKEVQAIFRNIIQNLSQTYDTPVFEPHVTLVSGLSGDENLLIKKIDSFTRNKKAIAVTLNDIDYTHGFFNALFIKIHNTPEIDQLNKQTRNYLRPFDQGHYHPHLSLLYGNITKEEKKHIISKLNISSKKIILDKLNLVRGNADVTQWRNIKEWSLA